MTMRTYPKQIDKLPVSITARYILLILFDYQANGLDMPSKSKLAQDINLSKQTVYKAFKELVEANYIEVESISGKKDKIIVKINFI